MLKLKNKKIIIVVGAARSGTSMLANIIRQLVPEEVIYLAEINETWKSPFKNKKYDTISKELINHKAVKKIRNKIKEISKVKNPENQTKNILLEKTAANCLRLPLVKKVFPDANFIHIIRDGRDVAISTRKKCLGDPRKITKNKSNPKKNIFKKFLYLIKTIINKIKSGTGIKDIVSNFKRYLTRILSLLGLKKKTICGDQDSPQ